METFHVTYFFFFPSLEAYRFVHVFSDLEFHGNMLCCESSFLFQLMSQALSDFWNPCAKFKTFNVLFLCLFSPFWFFFFCTFFLELPLLRCWISLTDPLISYLLSPNFCIFMFTFWGKCHKTLPSKFSYHISTIKLFNLQELFILWMFFFRISCSYFMIDIIASLLTQAVFIAWVLLCCLFLFNFGFPLALSMVFLKCLVELGCPFLFMSEYEEAGWKLCEHWWALTGQGSDWTGTWLSQLLVPAAIFLDDLFPQRGI